MSFKNDWGQFSTKIKRDITIGCNVLIQTEPWLRVEGSTTEDILETTGELRIWAGYYRISWNHCYLS